MDEKTHPQVLACEECGSTVVEIRGKLKAGAPIRCGDCGGLRGRWPDFLATIEATLEASRAARHQGAVTGRA